MAWGKVRPDPQLQLVSASVVEQPVLTNLRRARLLPAKGRFLVVNLATATLWMYEDGRATDSMKVVIGKADTPTPMLAGTIHYATFNPYWNIPTDVTRRVVAPLVIKRGVSYLKAARYEVASGWTDEATVVDPTTMASICTTRRPRIYSPRRSGLTAWGACASKTLSALPAGCSARSRRRRPTCPSSM